MSGLSGSSLRFSMWILAGAAIVVLNIGSLLFGRLPILVHEPKTLRGHSEQVRGVAFSPDGQQLASISWDKTLRTWDLSSGKSTIVARDLRGACEFVAFSSDGSKIAIAEAVFDSRSFLRLLSLKGANSAKALSADWKRLAAIDGRAIRIYDTETGESLLTIDSGSDAKCLALTPQSTLLVAPGRDHSITVWDYSNGREQVELHGHLDRVEVVTCTQRGELIASASRDSQINVLDANRGKLLLSLQQQPWIDSLAFSPNQKYLAAGNHLGVVRLWSIHTGKVLMTLRGHNGFVKSLAFSPDGRFLAVASSKREMSSLKVWNVESRLKP